MVNGGERKKENPQDQQKTASGRKKRMLKGRLLAVFRGGDAGVSNGCRGMVLEKG